MIQNRLNILIFGLTGMLGHTVAKYLSADPSLKVGGTVRGNGRGLDRNLTASCEIIAAIDIQNQDSVKNAIANFKPNVVINAVGIIKQLPSARMPLDTIPANALFPHQLSLMCEEYGSKLIHFSTDCVFSGKRGNYSELDLPDPHDLYGLTKLLGEVVDENSITIRTSIIGPELGEKKSLLEWFLSQNQEVNGFRNAIFSGFTTLEIAKILKQYIFPNLNKLSGVYHLSSTPITKLSLLEKINQEYKKGLKINPIDDISIDRSLNSEKIKSLIKYIPPTWDQMIHEMRHFG